jgi:hypothetical protein
VAYDNKEITAEDVTTCYIDIDTRLKAKIFRKQVY